jgi:hypothetical protein
MNIHKDDSEWVQIMINHQLEYLTSELIIRDKKISFWEGFSKGSVFGFILMDLLAVILIIVLRM